jgi:hypothetical protein
MYRKRYANGRSIKVTNYGICAFYSYNELMLLSHLFYGGNRPSIVIVLDGLNDFLLMNAAAERVPYYYYRLKSAGKDRLRLNEIEASQDSARQFLILGDSTVRGVDSLCHQLIGHYLSNLKNMRDLALRNGSKPFFFIQPTPFYNYPKKKTRPHMR